MRRVTTRALVLGLLASTAVLAGCNTVWNDSGPTQPTSTELTGATTTGPTPGTVTAATAATTTSGETATTITTDTTITATSSGTSTTPTPASVSTTTAPPGASTATLTPPADLQQILLERRDLSSAYVQFGELTRVGDELSATDGENGLAEWHRRTFRRNESTDRALLVTSSVRRYETAAMATDAFEERASMSTSLNATTGRVQLAAGTTVTVVRFRPESGTYGVTVLYRERDLVLALEALDPNRFYDGQARADMLRTISYLRAG